MKYFKHTLLAVAMICAGFVSKAQTAEEIIQKHFTAIGGLDNWKKVNSIIMHAVTNANGTEIPITLTILQGKGMKVEYTFSGMTGWAIITDKAGWNYSPFGGQTKPEAIPEEALKQSQDQLDAQGALVDYQAKGSTVTFLGKDEVEGTECYKIKVNYKTGKEETMFFDATNYYHIRSKSKITANGKEMEVTSNMGDFKKLPEGIVYPMSMDNGNGPMTIKSIEINKPLAENFFVPDMGEPKK
jgi:uncharacterized protein YxeA